MLCNNLLNKVLLKKYQNFYRKSSAIGEANPISFFCAEVYTAGCV